MSSLIHSPAMQPTRSQLEQALAHQTKATREILSLLVTVLMDNHQGKVVVDTDKANLNIGYSVEVFNTGVLGKLKLTVKMPNGEEWKPAETEPPARANGHATGEDVIQTVEVPSSLSCDSSWHTDPERQGRRCPTCGLDVVCEVARG